MEDEALARVEDRDGGGQLVQRAHVGVHLALQVEAHGLELRHVDGDADAAALDGRLGEVERAPRARDDGGDAQGGGRGLAPPPGLLAGRRVDELEAACQRRLALGLDRPRVGAVHPDEPAVAVAPPERLGQAVEEGGQRGEAAMRLLQRLARRDEVAPLPRDLAQAQERPPAHRPPLRLADPAGAGVDEGAKAGAALAQPVGRRRQRGRVRDAQPALEGEHREGLPVRAGLAGEEGGVPLDHRLAALGPGHDHLALGAHEELGAVVAAAQRRHLAGQRPLAGRPAPALVQVEHRQDGGEDDEADEDGEPDRVVGVQERDRLGRGEARSRGDGRDRPHRQTGARDARRSFAPHDPPCLHAPAPRRRSRGAHEAEEHPTDARRTAGQGRTACRSLVPGIRRMYPRPESRRKGSRRRTAKLIRRGRKKDTLRPGRRGAPERAEPDLAAGLLVLAPRPRPEDGRATRLSSGSGRA